MANMHYSRITVRKENREYWINEAKRKRSNPDSVYSCWQSYARNGGTLTYSKFKTKISK